MEKKMLNKQSIKSLQFVFSFLFIFIAWQLLSWLLSMPMLPGPVNSFKTFFQLLGGRLAPHLYASVARVMVSLGIALLIGIPMGIIIGYYNRFDSLTSPLIYLTYPIPKITLLPVFIGIFGIGELPKYTLISLIVFFQILVTVRDSVRSVSKQLVHSMISMGASDLNLFRHVFFPASLPKIFTALRISLGTALAVLFLTETFNTSYGIGYFILDASMRGRYTEVFAGIIAMSMLGLILFIIVDLLENKFCQWRAG